MTATLVSLRGRKETSTQPVMLLGNSHSVLGLPSIKFLGPCRTSLKLAEGRTSTAVQSETKVNRAAATTAMAPATRTQRATTILRGAETSGDRRSSTDSATRVAWRK